MTDLTDYKFKMWTVKPRELDDLEKMIYDAKYRKEQKVEFYDMIRMKEKVYASDVCSEYLKLISTDIAHNYGNYAWLLSRRKETSDLNERLAITSMLGDFRQYYNDKYVRNLPVSKEIKEDLESYNKEIVKAQENDAKGALETFGGSIVTEQQEGCNGEE